MTTTETTLVIILTVVLSIFIVACTAVAVALYKLVQTMKRVAEKAEDVVDSVEAAAEVFKDARGRLTLFKLAKNIFNLVQKRSRK